jgi:flagellar basal-body rod protein FlgB
MPNQSLYSALSGRMDYLSARQGVLASNIANADTPGYLSHDLAAPKSTGSFSKALTQAATQPGHMQAGSSASGVGQGTTSHYFIQHNGNSVRLDDELNKMNQTKLEYQMMTQLYSKQVALQKMALGRQ